ncbi:MAG: glycosyltransferase [Dysgonamonadaceae bacterium]|jgi:glycosyltransferase involved in cell wall biosynthesis|nr:glycosyltransferase [Dysgonamonadaceae bacterium]
MRKQLSIITINFNDAGGLQQTIRSVISQSFSGFEYIVIDGGSTDNSVDVIRQYESRISSWVSEPDSGVYNAMNKGIARAKGTYCLFLNSGDTFYSETTAEEVFSAHYTEEIITGNVLKQYPRKAVIDKGHAYRRAKKGQRLTLFDFFISNIPHQATFIKRDLFDRYGLYDERYKIVSDWLFFLKTIALNGVPVRYIDQTVARFNMDGVSNANMSLHLQERRKILEELLPPAILADYDSLEKIDHDFRKFFQCKMSYALGRLVNKTLTLFELILKRCKRPEFQS